ncbi:hypothetical protein GZH46_01821, partial [Fragariocoptes setiger]
MHPVNGSRCRVISDNDGDFQSCLLASMSSLSLATNSNSRLQTTRSKSKSRRRRTRRRRKRRKRATLSSSSGANVNGERPRLACAQSIMATGLIVLVRTRADRRQCVTHGALFSSQRCCYYCCCCCCSCCYCRRSRGRHSLHVPLTAICLLLLHVLGGVVVVERVEGANTSNSSNTTVPDSTMPSVPSMQLQRLWKRQASNMAHGEQPTVGPLALPLHASVGSSVLRSMADEDTALRNIGQNVESEVVTTLIGSRVRLPCHLASSAFVNSVSSLSSYMSSTKQQHQQQLESSSTAAADLSAQSPVVFPIDDAIALVFWFKDNQTTPIYTLDARRIATHGSSGGVGGGGGGAGGQVATHLSSAWHNQHLLEHAVHHTSSAGWSQQQAVISSGSGSTKLAESSSSNGSHWNNNKDSQQYVLDVRYPMAHLLIERVSPRHAGHYKCRIDYRRARTVQRSIVLNVIAGPFDEDTNVTLTCQTVDGSPTPTMRWLTTTTDSNNNNINSSSLLHVQQHNVEQMPAGVVATQLELWPVRRQYHGAKLTCLATNTNNLTSSGGTPPPAPLTKSLIVQLNLRPTTITIDVSVDDKSLPVITINSTDAANEPKIAHYIKARSGQRMHLVCASHGSLPAAQVQWYAKHESTSDPSKQPMQHLTVKQDKDKYQDVDVVRERSLAEWRSVVGEHDHGRHLAEPNVQTIEWFLNDSRVARWPLAQQQQQQHYDRQHERTESQSSIVQVSRSNQVSNKGTQLTLTRVTRSDQGAQLTCEAYNRVLLDVAHVKQLECRMNARPEPNEYVWSFEPSMKMSTTTSSHSAINSEMNSAANTEQSSAVTHRNEQAVMSSSSSSLMNVTARQYGLHVCRATNTVAVPSGTPTMTRTTSGSSSSGNEQVHHTTNETTSAGAECRFRVEPARAPRAAPRDCRAIAVRSVQRLRVACESPYDSMSRTTTGGAAGASSSSSASEMHTINDADAYRLELFDMSTTTSENENEDQHQNDEQNSNTAPSSPLLLMNVTNDEPNFDVDWPAMLNGTRAPMHRLVVRVSAVNLRGVGPARTISFSSNLDSSSSNNNSFFVRIDATGSHSTDNHTSTVRINSEGKSTSMAAAAAATARDTRGDHQSIEAQDQVIVSSLVDESASTGSVQFGADHTTSASVAQSRWLRWALTGAVGTIVLFTMLVVNLVRLKLLLSSGRHEQAAHIATANNNNNNNKGNNSEQQQRISDANSVMIYGAMHRMSGDDANGQMNKLVYEQGGTLVSSVESGQRVYSVLPLAHELHELRNNQQQVSSVSQAGASADDPRTCHEHAMCIATHHGTSNSTFQLCTVDDCVTLYNCDNVSQHRSAGAPAAATTIMSACLLSAKHSNTDVDQNTHVHNNSNNNNTNNDEDDEDTLASSVIMHACIRDNTTSTTGTYVPHAHKLNDNNNSSSSNSKVHFTLDQSPVLLTSSGAVTVASSDPASDATSGCCCDATNSCATNNSTATTKTTALAMNNDHQHQHQHQHQHHYIECNSQGSAGNSNYTCHYQLSSNASRSDIDSHAQQQQQLSMLCAHHRMHEQCSTLINNDSNWPTSDQCQCANGNSMLHLLTGSDCASSACGSSTVSGSLASDSAINNNFNINSACVMPSPRDCRDNANGHTHDTTQQMPSRVPSAPHHASDVCHDAHMAPVVAPELSRQTTTSVQRVIRFDDKIDDDLPLCRQHHMFL